MVTGDIHITAFGPLSVMRDGAPLECGGSAERSVLAALLLWAGRPVGVDRLTRTVWEPHGIPRNPNHALQTHVMRLRNHLGSDFITTGHRGYTAAVGAEVVDAHRFSALARDAERQLRQGRIDESERLFEAALALADRGDPWVDLGGSPTGDGERARLRELRLEAEERRSALGLRLGHAAPGEPERLAAEEPLREVRWELLMRAHMMAGRQADALRSYRRARHLLQTEIGIDPGSGLQSLERRVLQQDPTLMDPASMDQLLR